MEKSKALAVGGLVAIIVSLVSLTGTHAAGLDRDLTNYGLPAMGLAVIIDGMSKEGKEKKVLLNSAEAVAATALVTELLKATVNERRPNGGDGSFPSGHASAAFALATVLGRTDREHKWLYYVVASGIAWSRVSLRAHHTHDVIAGALLGNFIAERTLRFNERHKGMDFALLRKSW